ncbi:MAG: 23S rRNA (uracil(1939)-C(5))-methyltransferase RlmD [Gammaproteobacteria bacterium]|nr:23S rRNA (uracil(1939)-C(5))-methyltransferase RlmD [Gammaproteobacteria bacterium]
MANLTKMPFNVDISKLQPDGNGASEDGKTVVPGGLPGETLSVTPLARRHKVIYCRIEEVKTASKYRVECACPVADICGGCSLQHMEHSAQINFKQTNWLKTFATPPKEIIPALLGPKLNYRCKARLGVRFVEKKGRVLVGFREKMKGFITDTQSCKTLRLPAGDLLKPLSKLIMALSDPKSVPQIEVACGDSTTALVVRHLGQMSKADLKALEKFSNVHGIHLYMQPAGIKSIYRLAPRIAEPFLHYDLYDHDIRMHFMPLDFTQVNHSINRSMVNLALDLLSISQSDQVFDAFSGIGNFSLPIARRAGRVIGAELSSESVARARYNATENGIENATFVELDLFKDFEQDFLKQTSHLLLDPPRSGAECLMRSIVKSNVRRVVYVSCNPQTLARDIEILVKGGFGFDKAGVIDMFPHTAHIESIALLSR